MDGVAEGTQMVTFLSYIGKLLLEVFIISIGLLTIFISTIFIIVEFLDLLKDERKKSK